MEAYAPRPSTLPLRKIVDARQANQRPGFPVRGRCRTRVERYTVLRGPFVDKKSREQFEIPTHKRIRTSVSANARTG
ncbi:UNVERIFIED_CONTAM: hypothetical protein GTU68_045465 [Idotea baltica]|nr:hypothetical protein [Idotea baltica]